jgi:small subunit ribosomal protein S16
LVKIRLMPMGKKKRPFYRIVAIDVRSQSQGKSLGLIGHYDPMNAKLNLDHEAAIGWLKRGAQMTPTVEDLLRSQGILAQLRGLEGTVKENVLSQDKPKRRRKLQAASSAAAEEQKAEATTEEAPAEATAEEAPAAEETAAGEEEASAE